MPALLTISDLLGAIPAGQLADVSASAPAGEDPVTVIMLHACATVDGYVGRHMVPAGMMTRWARDLAAYDVAKLLDKPTDAQRVARDTALAALAEVRDGKFSNGTTGFGWGSKPKF